MNWNNQQLVAIAAIESFVFKPFDQNNPDGWAITIEGYAGTGKTTMVQQAIKNCIERNPNLQVCVTAPTNKATQVLNTFGREAGIVVDTCTIYSLLGLVLGSEGEVKQCFQAHNGNFDMYNVVIIDESSMVGNQLMDAIVDRATNYGTKVIFMGDPGQLNPVNETRSRVFSPEVPEVYKLTQIMRQDDGNPIREVVGHLREWTDSGQTPPKFITSLTPEEDGVHCMNMKDFQDAMLDQFDSEEYQQDPRFCRALAWTNKEVNRLNRVIRNRIYGADCEDFVVGETIVVLTPVMNEGGEPVIFTDDECVIQSIGTATMTDNNDRDAVKDIDKKYKVWVLNVKMPTGGTHRIFALHADDLQKYKKRCNKLANDAKAKVKPWKMFWAFKEMFTEVRPAHAMTIHKSQGQTFNTIFVNVRDAMNNRNPKERARLSYVACSRPTTNLVINKMQLG